MNTLEEMQTAAFQIITYAGEARSNYVEAIRIARAGEIEEARQKITEGETSYNQIHKVHASLIQREASGEQLPFSLILMHAEDQMLTTETLKIMASEMVEMCGMILNKTS
ncbi:PTS lactose/cellobiose transporter subunit IIA [Cytobacillus oceanisediminis]|uniref:PTS lactose/cellobiose transporter subunit IIA n=2 Tax=Niallia TaxID=2837506 RepID=A0A941JM20_NIACI|nr:MULTISPECIES: PTS lactose/cellobiose transporter subunit IIA [Bacillaceae]EOR24030.1 PTS system cellobiose transporter subunit IIA [Niallia nealsonii AAU1]MDU1844941.1 PTS lactose/cellobiose transporter subunit IIA [Niallia nealsonii]MBZ9534416.1 PTS lactose/cellobiose transporter subunit IIA [Cytobacillus oceanisediminis]MCB5236378.1 PTS lactose/cellobiose transporter subunit IIA [Niallia circulans]MED3791429.1 PTS lactose/cellobiose transporter subunit IIA [Niallia alba]